MNGAELYVTRGSVVARGRALRARQTRDGAADRPGADREADLRELCGGVDCGAEHVRTVRWCRRTVARPWDGGVPAGWAGWRRRVGFGAPSVWASPDSGGGGLRRGWLGLCRLGPGPSVRTCVNDARGALLAAAVRPRARQRAEHVRGGIAGHRRHMIAHRGLRRGPRGNGIERIAQFAGRNLKRVSQFYVVVITTECR